MIHPETGEVLESKEALEAALKALDERMIPLYRVRRELRAAWAEHSAPVIPQARYRTQTQEKVARCPRCGGKLEEKEEGRP